MDFWQILTTASQTRSPAAMAEKLVIQSPGLPMKRLGAFKGKADAPPGDAIPLGCADPKGRDTG